MFKKKRAREERDREIVQAINDYMDEREAYSWERRKAIEEVGEEEAARRFPPADVADTVADLLALADNNINRVLDGLEKWYDSMDIALEDEDEDRRQHAAGLYIAVASTGVGNLYGSIPDTALMFDPKLAAEGRSRGWRQ